MSVRITNFGLDAVAAVSSDSAGSGRPSFTRWFNYTAIGTGTSTPSQSDTQLAAEIARTANNGGFSPTESYVRDPSANVIRATITEYRVFNFTASYNLTEYGHFTGSTGANCVYRDLFRQDPNDPNSTPVVISVQNGDQLQIVVTLIIEIPWLEQTYSFDIANIGTVTGVGTAFATSDYSGLYAIKALWPGESLQGRLLAITSSGQSAARGQSVNVNDVNYPSFSADAYTSGTYQRTKRATMSTSYANGNIYGFVISYLPLNPAHDGHKFLLTSPAYITKDNLHTLTLVFQVTWSRRT